MKSLVLITAVLRQLSAPVAPATNDAQVVNWNIPLSVDNQIFCYVHSGLNPEFLEILACWNMLNVMKMLAIVLGFNVPIHVLFS
jgi:hypothetical protein